MPAKVRRNEWGVSFSGSGGRCCLARFVFARSTATSRTRERMFSREGRRPVRVANTNPLGSIEGCPRTSCSSARRAPRIFTRRRPADVLASMTLSHPAARSTSDQRSAHNSPIRRPANVSVASIARRWTCWRSLRASPSSSPAASNRAAICAAVSR